MSLPVKLAPCHAEPSSPPSATEAEPPVARGHLATVSWVVIARVAAIAANLALGVVLARNLSQADYGRFELLVSIITFVGILAALGLSDAVLRLVSEALALHEPARADWTLRRSAKAALFAGLASLALTPALLHFFTSSLDVTTSLIVVVGLSGVFLGWLRIASMALQAMENHKWAHLLGSGQQAGGVALLCLLALVGGLLFCQRLSLESLMWAYVATMGVTTVGAILLTRATQRRHLQDLAAPEAAPAKPETLAGLLRAAFPLFVIQLVSMGAYYADTWLAAFYTDPETLALYAVARRVILLVSLPMQFTDLSLRHVIPRMYVRGEKAKLQHLLQTAALLGGACTLSAIVLLVFAGDWVVTIMYGASYAASYRILLILAGGQLVFTLTGICTQVLVFTGYHRMVLWIEAAGLVLFLLAAPVLAAQYGIMGLAIASTICLAAKSVSLWLSARRLTGLWTHPYYRRFPPPSPASRGAAVQ